MDKQKVFEEAHTDLIHVVNRLTLDNLSESEESILKYLSFFKQLVGLPDVERPNEDKEVPKQTISGNPEAKESAAETDGTIYTLDRKLKGGFLMLENDESQSIFIMEGKIRKQGFEHGDLIKAIPQGERYNFELVKRQEHIRRQSNRRQLDYCILNKRDSIWMCDSQFINGEERIIKLDEVPYSFIIPEEDVKEYELEKGSIIDLAYYEPNPNRGKIVYVHNSEINEYQAPQPAGYYKKERSTEFTEVEKEELINFQGKSILVVGLEARKKKFQQEIELRGGQMIWASGNEEKSRLESMVKKSDMAVVIIQHTSHRGSIKTAEFCKKHNVKFCATQSRGVDSLLTAITNSIEELEFLS